MHTLIQQLPQTFVPQVLQKYIYIDQDSKSEIMYLKKIMQSEILVSLQKQTRDGSEDKNE